MTARFLDHKMLFVEKSFKARLFNLLLHSYRPSFNTNPQSLDTTVHVSCLTSASFELAQSASHDNILPIRPSTSRTHAFALLSISHCTTVPLTSLTQRLASPSWMIHIIRPLNLAHNVVPLAEEFEPIVQHRLLFFVQIVPVGDAFFGFQGAGGEGAGRVFAGEDCSGVSVRSDAVRCVGFVRGYSSKLSRLACPRCM